MGAEEVLAGGLSAAPVSPVLGLVIAVVVPGVLAFLKKVAPKLPGFALPFLAPLIGVLTDLLVQYGGGDAIGAAWAALLGSAGVGLREAADQTKKKIANS